MIMRRANRIEAGMQVRLSDGVIYDVDQKYVGTGDRSIAIKFSSGGNDAKGINFFPDDLIELINH